MPKRDDLHARPGHRLRADPHRPGRGVRLLRHAGLPGAQGRGPAGHAHQLQPGDDHDRPGVRRRDLHRADHARSSSPRSSRRSAPTRCSPTLGGQTALNAAMALHEAGRPRAVRRRARSAPTSTRSARGEDRQAVQGRSSRASAPRAPAAPSATRWTRCSRRPTSSATRSSCARRSRWAAAARGIAHDEAAAAPHRRRRAARQPDDRGPARGVDPRLEGVRARADARQATTTSSSSARSRTSTRWACTPATRSPSRRR